MDAAQGEGNARAVGVEGRPPAGFALLVWLLIEEGVDKLATSLALI
jgi:hypothetical protein